MVKEIKIISYDYKNDILYLSTGKEVKESLQVDNFVIDFSYKNKIVGIEIFNTSKVLSKLSEVRITKKMLKESLKASQLVIYVGKEIIVIGVLLLFSVKPKKVQTSIPLPVKIMK